MFPLSCLMVESRGVTVDIKSSKSVMLQEGSVNESFIIETQREISGVVWIVSSSVVYDRFEFARNDHFEYLFKVSLCTTKIKTYNQNLFLDFGDSKPLFKVAKLDVTHGTTIVGSGKGVWIDHRAMVRWVTGLDSALSFTHPARCLNDNSCKTCGAGYFYVKEKKSGYDTPRVTCMICHTVIDEGVKAKFYPRRKSE